MSSDIMLILATAFQPVLMVLLGIVARVAVRRFNLEHDDALRANLERALQSAAGLAYAAMARRSLGYDQALAEATRYVADRVPGTITRLGVSDADALRAMVEGRLGRLLSADPTVSIAQAPPRSS